MSFWAYAFMQRALIAGALIGATAGAVGVYVVLRGFSFIGAGIAHAAFGGVAIAVLLGIDPLWGALLFSLLVAWGIVHASRRGHIREEIAIGILFASSMALGVLLLNFVPGYRADLFGYLFGNILAVSPRDLVMSVALAGVVFVGIALFYKEFLLITFDPGMAEAQGFPVGALQGGLLSLVALTVVLSLRVVGAVLVAALLVVPAATAYQFVRNFHRLVLLSAALGVGEVVAGLILSFYLDIPSGPTIVLLSAALFGLALVARRR
ncbi:metal ABC transporter permease [Candidatus Bipolaricaulota sp. J31]